MNIFLLIASGIALFCTVGHLIVGGKMYLAPLLNSSIDRNVKMLPAGAMVNCFIGVNSASFAIVQIIIALTSGSPKILVRLPQCVFLLRLPCSRFWEYVIK